MVLAACDGAFSDFDEYRVILVVMTFHTKAGSVVRTFAYIIRTIVLARALLLHPILNP